MAMDIMTFFFSWHLFFFSLRVVTYICSYDHDKTFFDGYKTYLANTSHGFVQLVHVISVISVFNFFFSKKNKKRKINFDTVAIRENE